MDTFPRTWSNWSLWGKCQKLISWRAQGLVCLNKVLKNWVSNSVIGKLLPVSKLNWNTFDFEAKPQALKMSGKGLNCQNLVTVFLSSLTLKVHITELLRTFHRFETNRTGHSKAMMMMNSMFRLIFSVPRLWKRWYHWKSQKLQKRRMFSRICCQLIGRMLFVSLTKLFVYKNDKKVNNFQKINLIRILLEQKLLIFYIHWTITTIHTFLVLTDY